MGGADGEAAAATTAMPAAPLPGMSLPGIVGGSMMATTPNMMPGMTQPLQVAGRKQRELYVGNLAQGIVTADMLKEWFNDILRQCPGHVPQMGPPVACVQLSGEGRFAFVEFRDVMMAVTALQLDKAELAGRALNIGRPAGFVASTSSGPPPTPLPLPPGIVKASGGAVGAVGAGGAGGDGRPLSGMDEGVEVSESGSEGIRSPTRTTKSVQSVPALIQVSWFVVGSWLWVVGCW